LWLLTGVITIGTTDRDGARLAQYLAHCMWTEIGFSANHKSELKVRAVMID
jgi:hypothetical protein